MYFGLATLTRYQQPFTVCPCALWSKTVAIASRQKPHNCKMIKQMVQRSSEIEPLVRGGGREPIYKAHTVILGTVPVC